MPPLKSRKFHKRAGRLFKDRGFTVMFLTSEQNEHVWRLHHAHFLYFLMCLMPNVILNKICNKINIIVTNGNGISTVCEMGCHKN